MSISWRFVSLPASKYRKPGRLAPPRLIIASPASAPAILWVLLCSSQLHSVPEAGGDAEDSCSWFHPIRLLLPSHPMKGGSHEAPHSPTACDLCSDQCSQLDRGCSQLRQLGLAPLLRLTASPPASLLPPSRIQCSTGWLFCGFRNRFGMLPIALQRNPPPPYLDETGRGRIVYAGRSIRESTLWPPRPLGQGPGGWPPA